MAGTFLASIWKGHAAAADTEDFLAYLGEIQLQAASTGAQVVLAGDWNWLPAENPLLRDYSLTIVAAVDSNGQYCPTRWQGHRAID